MDLLEELGIELPVLAAPMAGGPTTPALVDAAAAAGSLGLLAAGYKTADGLAAELDEVGGTFGVNLFAPHPVPVDLGAYRAYREELLPLAEQYGVELPEVMAAHGPTAPLGYPALHHLTTPIRRAAAAAGDPDNVNLWAGTGYRAAREAPAAQILADLAVR